MRVTVICTFLVLGLAAALSAPSSHPQGVKIYRKFTKSDHHINDRLSDLIKQLTGKDVVAFIVGINKTIEASEKLIKDVTQEIAKILATIGDEARQEIEAILNRAIADAVKIVEPIVTDLSILLPAITRVETKLVDVSDLIEIILGKSLEKFLIEVGTALSSILTLVNDTCLKLEKLADSLAHDAAVQIKALLSKTLTDTKELIDPILYVIRECVDLFVPSPKLRHVRETREKGQIILKRAERF